jgi:hypothetical protein
MNVNIHRQFPEAAVDAILREAVRHVETIAPPDDLREAVLLGAVRLASVTLVETPQAVDLGALTRNAMNHKRS